MLSTIRFTASPFRARTPLQASLDLPGAPVSAADASAPARANSAAPATSNNSSAPASTSPNSPAPNGSGSSPAPNVPAPGGQTSNQPPAGPGAPPDKPQPPPPGPPPNLPNGAQSAGNPPPPAPEQPPKLHHLPFEKPTTVSITRTFEEPVMHEQQLGSIPSDWYQWTWGAPIYGYGFSIDHPCYGGTCEAGPIGVYRNVPDYNADGTPMKQQVTRTITANTYNQAYRTAGFGLLAGAAGVGGAALTGALIGGHAGPLGMAVGGAVGAVAGAVFGYRSAKGDTLKEVWKTENIEHPTMTGFTEWLQPSYHYEQWCHPCPDPDGRGEHEECESREVLDGYWHQYSPDISWKTVGQWDHPTLQHTAKVGSVGGSFMALGGGVALGAAAAALLAFI